MASAACLEEIGLDLECSICMETFDDPRVLTCQHVFCLKCLEALCKSLKVATCPICRTDVPLDKQNGVQSLPKPLILNKLRETLSSLLETPKVGQTVPTCTEICVLCEGLVKSPATLLCQDCQENMCNGCFDNHVTASGFEGHVSSDIKRYPSCTTHSSTLCKQYCTNCLVPTCVKCVFGVHKGHTFKDIKTAKDEEKQKLGHDLVTMKTMLDQLSLVTQKQTDLAEQTLSKFDFTIASLKDWTKKITAKMTLVTENMIPMLEERKRQKLKILEHNKRSLKEMTSELIGQTQKMTSAMNGNDVDEILHTSKMTKECQSKLDKINSHLTLDVNVECPSLTLPNIETQIHNILSTCEPSETLRDYSEEKNMFKAEHVENKTLKSLDGVSRPCTSSFEPTHAHPSKFNSLPEAVFRGIQPMSPHFSGPRFQIVEPTNASLQFSEHQPSAVCDSRLVSPQPASPSLHSEADWKVEATIDVQANKIIDMIGVPSENKIYLRAEDISNAGHLLVYDMATQKLVNSFHLGGYNDETGIAFDTKRRHVILGSYPNRFQQFSADGRQAITHHSVEDMQDVCRMVYCVSLDSLAVTDTVGQEVHIIGCDTYTRVRRFRTGITTEDPLTQPVFIDFDRIGKVFAVSDKCRGKIITFDIDGCQTSSVHCISDPSDLTYSPTGKLYGCTYNGPDITLWKSAGNGDICGLSGKDKIKSHLCAISAVSDDVIVAVGHPHQLVFVHKQH